MYSELITAGIILAFIIIIIVILINKKPKPETECMTGVVAENDSPTPEQTDDIQNTRVVDPELQDQINQVLSIQDAVLHKKADSSAI